MITIVSGAVLAVLIVITTAVFERTSLRLRGYRRLSRDEVHRIAPLVKAVADDMELPGLPRFAMVDMNIPNAWTHMRTIVLSTSLLYTLSDRELEAVLAHELHHWRSGDSVGLHFVWAGVWPVALLYSLGKRLTGTSPQGTPVPMEAGSASGTAAAIRGFMTLLGWIISWPAFVIMRLIIVPMTARTQRGYEYQADAAAYDIGRADDMISALRKMTAFEGGRTGWEQAMASTHPPAELRIEALQGYQPDDAQYQEDELRSSWRDIRRLLGALLTGTHAAEAKRV